MLRLLISAGFACLLASTPAAAQVVANFENLALAPQSFENGASLPGFFTSGGATFNNNYSAAFGAWSGWSYSNMSNTTTAGFGNQYAAYAPATASGSGDNSANYGVAFAFSPGDATITLPAALRPQSIRVTNTTYAAISMRDGDAFAKKFGGPTGNDPDFFLLTIAGRNALNQLTGSVDFYLADYRFTNNALDYIVSQWTTIDLTSLGADTTRLDFGFTSSDNGPFGINTPTYVAADNLVMTAVPEPGSFTLLALAGLAAWRVQRQKAISRKLLRFQ
jgi:Domain of unknown function (DUF4465)/PEP-CTERM motif